MLANEVLVGDALTRMAEIPDGWAHVAVTSPPYYGLRQYLAKGHPDRAKEIGSEPTPDEYIETLLGVFRGVRRILRDDGQFWLNMGDSYGSGEVGRHDRSDGCVSEYAIGRTSQGKRTTVSLETGVPAGCQLLMPHRLALAMIADSWCLRSTVIWSKASPMPESVSGWRWRRCRVKVRSAARIYRNDSQKPVAAYDGKDFARNEYEPCPGCKKCIPNGGYVLRRGKWRPTNSFEYLFQFSKGGDYFGDGDAVAEASIYGSSGLKPKKRGEFGDKGTDPSMAGREPFKAITETRNPRSVWTFPNEPFKGKHFATYPSSLPKRCIEASTSKAGCCANCGAQYAPVVESVRKPTRPGITNVLDDTGSAKLDTERHVTANIVTDYRGTCDHTAGPIVPCRVFDPFLGSGQTARAAHWLGRTWLGCELNQAYADLVPGRIAKKPKWADEKYTATVAVYPDAEVAA